MAYLYAISDPHGCLDALEQALASLDLSGDNHLYLLGDYIPHERQDMSDTAYERSSIEALGFVHDFQAAHKEHVTVLCGNHELYYLMCVDEGKAALTRSLYRWVWDLPAFAEADRQIFVHAGVDEEAGDYWRWGSTKEELCGKFPASVGFFEKNVVAGHISAAELARQNAGADDFEGVFWDGASHYYIDGATERSGKINILRYDTERERYLQRIATASGVGDFLPID